MSQAVPASFQSLGDFSQLRLPGLDARDVKELVASLAQMTREVFACDVQVADDGNPEYPEERYVVFIVEPRASAQQLIEMEAQWVKRLRSTAPDWDGVRLSIRLPE